MRGHHLLQCWYWLTLLYWNLEFLRATMMALRGSDSTRWKRSCGASWAVKQQKGPRHKQWRRGRRHGGIQPLQMCSAGGGWREQQILLGISKDAAGMHGRVSSPLSLCSDGRQHEWPRENSRGWKHTWKPFSPAQSWHSTAETQLPAPRSLTALQGLAQDKREHVPTARPFLEHS